MFVTVLTTSIVLFWRVGKMLDRNKRDFIYSTKFVKKKYFFFIKNENDKKWLEMWKLDKHSAGYPWIIYGKNIHVRTQTIEI